VETESEESRGEFMRAPLVLNKGREGKAKGLARLR